jgi:hypothetical protein
MKESELEKMERELEECIERDSKLKSVQSCGLTYYEPIMTGDNKSLKSFDEFVKKYEKQHAIKKTASIKEASDAFFLENKAYLLVNGNLSPVETSRLVVIKHNTGDTSCNSEIQDYFSKALKRIVNHLYPEIEFDSYSIEYGLDDIVFLESIKLYNGEEYIHITDYNDYSLVIDLLGTLFDDGIIPLNHENKKVYKI